jgi:hypothetical protein
MVLTHRAQELELALEAKKHNLKSALLEICHLKLSFLQNCWGNRLSTIALVLQSFEEDDIDDSDSFSDSLSSSCTSDEDSESFKGDGGISEIADLQSNPQPADCAQTVITAWEAVAPADLPPAHADQDGGGECGWDSNPPQAGQDGPGICHRTRARCPLQDVTLEQLEAFTLPEEDLLPMSDAEYYQEFLEVRSQPYHWMVGLHH